MKYITLFKCEEKIGFLGVENESLESKLMPTESTGFPNLVTKEGLSSIL